MYYGFGKINARNTLSWEHIRYNLARIRNPRPNQQFNKGTVSIEGTALASDFSHYKVERGSYFPVSAGISLENDGKQEVIDGKLASLDLSSLTDGQYDLRLRVYSRSGDFSEHIISFSVCKSIPEGWPHEILSGPEFRFNHPVIADVDGDRDLEIFAASRGGVAYAWHYDGKNVSGWPVTLGGQVSTPAVADIDRDGIPEIVVGVSNPGAQRKVYVLKNNAAAYSPAWPKEFNEDRVSNNVPPVLADIDGNNNNDILFGNGSTLYCWDSNGGALEGWPVRVDDENEIITGIAVGIIDSNDTGPAIVATTVLKDASFFENQYFSRGKIYAWDKKGSVIQGGRLAIVQHQLLLSEI